MEAVDLLPVPVRPLLKLSIGSLFLADKTKVITGIMTQRLHRPKDELEELRDSWRGGKRTGLEPGRLGQAGEAEGRVRAARVCNVNYLLGCHSPPYIKWPIWGIFWRSSG